MPQTSWTELSQTSTTGWQEGLPGRGDAVVVLLAVPIQQARYFDNATAFTEMSQSATAFTEMSKTADSWTEMTG